MTIWAITKMSPAYLYQGDMLKLTININNGTEVLEYIEYSPKIEGLYEYVVWYKHNDKNYYLPIKESQKKIFEGMIKCN